MNSGGIREQIQVNADEIVRLHSRIREKLKHRDESPEQRAEWEKACKEFHKRYDILAFPGGYADALERISKGDPNAMEAAICWLEIRPYFFRSGYMFKDILRACRRAPLNSKHVVRLATIERKLAEWREKKLK